SLKKCELIAGADCSYNRFSPTFYAAVVVIRLSDEWHLDFRKSLASADIGKKGLSCSDGVCDNPISGKEAQGCAILTKDGFGNKCNFCDVNSCRMEICRSRMFSRKTSLHRRSQRSAYSGMIESIRRSSRFGSFWDKC